MEPITLNGVNSSMISGVGFGKEKDDDQTGVVEVQFANNGKRWRYYGVTEALYDDMVASPSIGRFFLANIKNKFRGEEVFS